MDGRCSRFVDYIMSALTKQGCHHQYDIEGALQRIVFKMLGAVGERGLAHKGVFDFDENCFDILRSPVSSTKLAGLCFGLCPRWRCDSVHSGESLFFLQ